MYADNTHLTYAGSNLEIVQFCLNEDLANDFNWLQANKLTLNMTKPDIHANRVEAETGYSHSFINFRVTLNFRNFKVALNSLRRRFF